VELKTSFVVVLSLSLLLSLTLKIEVIDILKTNIINLFSIALEGIIHVEYKILLE